MLDILPSHVGKEQILFRDFKIHCIFMYEMMGAINKSESDVYEFTVIACWCLIKKYVICLNIPHINIIQQVRE